MNILKTPLIHSIFHLLQNQCTEIRALSTLTKKKGPSGRNLQPLFQRTECDHVFSQWRRCSLEYPNV